MCLHPIVKFACNSNTEEYIYTVSCGLCHSIFSLLLANSGHTGMLLRGDKSQKLHAPLFVATWLEINRSFLQTYRIRTIILPFKISNIIDFLLEDATKEIGTRSTRGRCEKKFAMQTVLVVIYN